MTHSEIGKLLGVISIHYPNHMKNTDLESVIKEWHRIIGFLDYDEALARLDAYMEDAENKKPPMAIDFKRVKPRKALDVFHAPIEHQWKIIKGRLYDEEDREYVVDPTCELPFYYDEEGNICQGNRLLFHRTKSGRSQ